MDEVYLQEDLILCSDYAAEEHSAQEVKKEVELHLAEKEIIEATIPSNIIIGPFWINTDSVRQNLSKKRKNLSNAVLELLAQQLRKQADDVSIYSFQSFAYLAHIDNLRSMFGEKIKSENKCKREAVYLPVTGKKCCLNDNLCF